MPATPLTGRFGAGGGVVAGGGGGVVVAVVGGTGGGALVTFEVSMASLQDPMTGALFTSPLYDAIQ